MDDLLEVKMLGSPVILYHNLPLTFPYRQVEALFYYLLMNRRVNKYTLADIIWGDACSEARSLSNLRNAFYTLRKFLGKDFIEKQAADQIILNSRLPIKVDVEQFLHASGSSALYTGDFLEGFYLKNNTLYNDWLEKTRELLKSAYGKKLQEAVACEFKRENLEECEALCRKQLELNEFDETAYRHLMQIYKKKKNYTLALKLYGRLEELFEEELFDVPCEETQELAFSIEEAYGREISSLLKGKMEFANTSDKVGIFYGRQGEQEFLRTGFASFYEGGDFRHLLISGEAGVGKTRLAEQQILRIQAEKPEFICLRMRCYYAEERYILKPWQSAAKQLLRYMEQNGLTEAHPFLSQGILGLFPFLAESMNGCVDLDDISTLGYKSIQSVFVNAFLHFSQSRPVVLYIDDVQWADEISLALIRDLATSQHSGGSGRIMLLMTARNTPGGDVKRLFHDLSALDQLGVCSLNRFDFRDTGNMAALLLPEYHFTPELRKQLFRETEGNALFITEAVNHLKYNGIPGDLSPNICNIIEQRIAPLSPVCRQILNLLSIFFDGATFECLSALSRKEDYELAEILEILMEQNLLREELLQEDTFFSFTHQKLSEYIYQGMSQTKKRMLHGKAAAFCESRLKGNYQDMPLYPKLIYHFDKSANQKKYLKYAVKYLYNYLNVTHEFFPVIDSKLTLFTLDMRVETKDQLSEDLTSIEKLLHSVEERFNGTMEDFLGEGGEQLEELEILSDYLHMTGRYYIRACEYKRGCGYIRKLKEINEKFESPFRLGKLLQANRQMVCVYINRYETVKLAQVIEESFRLLSGMNMPEEEAVWQRLWGFCDIMDGRFSDGIRHLETAIECFTVTPEREKHLYNLAAAYAWIGEAHRLSGKSKEAANFYDKAIEICSRNFLVSGVAIFYAYAGMAAYESGELDLAKEHLLESIRRYEQGNLMWGRSLPYSYYSMILAVDEEWEEARRYLQTAKDYAGKLENPYELGIVNQAYGSTHL